MQGARLAFDLANETEALPVEVIATAYATEEDPTRAAELMADAVADPSTVAAIVWPGGTDASALRAADDLAVVDLSPVGDPGSGSWSRLVDTDRAQAEALAGLVEGHKACLAGDDGERGASLVEAVSAELDGRGVDVRVQELVSAGLDSYSSLVAVLEEQGCHTLVWTGGAVEAATILEEAGGALKILGSDRLINEGFPESAGDAADGTVATCPCGDISSSTDLEVQRFVQEYQSRYGTAPSAYAAEGWDAAQLVMDAIAAVGQDRTAIADALRPPFDTTGLLRTYHVGGDGESRPGVVAEQVRGGTWAPKANDR
jgi:branched-chain amino acid transport system substrate-binding protein